MTDLSASRVPGSWRSWAVLSAVVVGIFLLAWWKMPPRFVSADFICYWSAAKLISSGQSPYDIALQTQIQQELGWDKHEKGLDIYDCLPYFYPPWFALACTVLLPLGYTGAKYGFLLVNIAATLSAGYLLRDAIKGVARWVPIVFLPLFVFTLVAVFVGQTSLLVCLLIALAWRLLDQGRDRTAGVVLAWLTVKPQLTAVLLLGVLVWLLRRRRWDALWAFAVTLGLLALVSTLFVPNWPMLMLHAPRETPPPTDYFPWIGNAWFLLLRSFDLSGAALWLLYLALAVPVLVATVRAALDPSRPLSDVLGLGVLAAFFVAPYARHYDFPVLVIPFLILLGGRLSDRAGAALLVALILGPYVQFYVLGELKKAHGDDARFLHECSFFWIPLLLGAAWVATARARKPRTFPAAVL
jgi:hypothetical protein